MTSCSTFAERLVESLAEAGLSKSDLARACSVSPASVTDWCKGRTKSVQPENLAKAAAALGVSVSWLFFGDGDKHSSSVGVVDRDYDDKEFVMIPEMRYLPSAQGGVQETRKACYRRDFFEERRLNPDDCIQITVQGNDMDPVLCDRDSVLVNRNYQQLIGGKIYAILFNGQLLFRYLAPRLNGDIAVSTAKSEHGIELISKESQAGLLIVGVIISRSGDV